MALPKGGVSPPQKPGAERASAGGGGRGRWQEGGGRQGRPPPRGRDDERNGRRSEPPAPNGRAVGKLGPHTTRTGANRDTRGRSILESKRTPSRGRNICPVDTRSLDAYNPRRTSWTSDINTAGPIAGKGGPPAKRRFPWAKPRRTLSPYPLYTSTATMRSQQTMRVVSVQWL